MPNSRSLLPKALAGGIVGGMAQHGFMRRKRRVLQAQSALGAVLRGEQGMLRIQLSGGRLAHAVPEDKSVIRGFGHDASAFVGAIEQAGFVTPAEARAVFQGWIAEGRGQEIVQPGGARARRRLAGLQQFFEQGLLGERVDELIGGDLLLAFDQPEQLPAQIDTFDTRQAGVPVDQLELPADGVEIIEYAAEALDGFDLFGGNAAGVQVFGVHPVLHLCRVAAHQDMQRAVAADEQHGQLAGLAVRGDAATADAAAVLADDRAQIGLGQAKVLARVGVGFGKDRRRIGGMQGGEVHGGLPTTRSIRT